MPKEIVPTDAIIPKQDPIGLNVIFALESILDGLELDMWHDDNNIYFQWFFSKSYMLGYTIEVNLIAITFFKS